MIAKGELGEYPIKEIHRRSARTSSRLYMQLDSLEWEEDRLTCIGALMLICTYHNHHISHILNSTQCQGSLAVTSTSSSSCALPITVPISPHSQAIQACLSSSSPCSLPNRFCEEKKERKKNYQLFSSPFLIITCSNNRGCLSPNFSN